MQFRLSKDIVAKHRRSPHFLLDCRADAIHALYPDLYFVYFA